MANMYSNLLAHLQQSTSTVDLETIQGTLAYHLAHLSPLPTPLAASAVSAPLFVSSPFTFEKLDTLSTAFRHAVHIKHVLLTKEAEQTSVITAVFTRGTRTRLAQWADALIKGLQGGQPIMRLACSTGILMGMHDFENLRLRKGPAENQVVLSLAEVMDLFRSFQLSSASSSSEWEKEFQPMRDHELLSAAFILSSQSLPLVVVDKLKALPLDVLGRLLTSTISTAFSAGTFLTSSDAISSPLLTYVAQLSRLSSLTHAALIDSRPRDGLVTAQETLDSLESICARVETDWTRQSTPPDNDNTWLVLKTFLFSTIMISESILSAAIYATPSPAPLGLTTLRALGHLSFVIQQFGGITPSSNFIELKKAVYLALDVVASSTREGEAEEFISRLLRSQHKAAKEDLAQKAFILACAEQLVPVLKDPRDVFALCEGHLNSQTHRETYESAHSVVLAVLSREDMEEWVAKTVPRYASCLVENSCADGLDTVQLCLAFHTLVKSASRQEDVMGWLAVEQLLDAIERFQDDDARTHRLRLALISCVSAVRGVKMLDRILSEVRRVIKGRQEVERLGEEVIERVGDREKAFVIEWWASNRKRLEAEYKEEAQPILARL